ncbi:class I SAM-dependent DNA methyltransferase [Rhodoblastus sp. 17X3]|uniref:class I SAM-dependent DNA methyltransferase n=1 Tax=Rhodoblastus sp. 17X3 TaxID=3047026 RepID=UPI0024B699C8|nr:DNA methyltransferase [Rhodoblastus sp. 17X3]MDI9848974.1 class I SAM-dependent DNA methyltransferase [Rhodoblastus sp. 17X3]
MNIAPPQPSANIESFIARWSGGDGGQERANYALFLAELCDVLGAARPDQASHDASTNAYTFERAVTFREPDGSKSAGRIDLYKRGCFVLEAKQSRRPGAAKAAPEQGDLLAAEEIDATPRGKRTATRAWDVLMMSARRQAEDYAKALPVTEGWPPFLIVCDVGHCFEIFADFSGQGKNYAQFPDRQGFRIYLEDLRDAEVRERLRLIWHDPHKLDPTKIAAKATRKIAERLAKVSKHLEEARDKDGKPVHDPEAVALFLMRCLFTMFAEDVELLPKGSFRDILQKCVAKPELFPRLIGQLWEAMDTGGFSYALERDVLKFNGYLFKDRTALKLPREEISELYEASKADWRQVEPAIFGTLLEQALNPAERRKLGAHYTPRAYVERLVVTTVLEPLKAEWANVQAAAESRRASGDPKAARAIVNAFHDKLCGLRILDPACGTGNFLYVSLELMKRLEGEVLEASASLAEQARFMGYEAKTIDPHQFLGLEVNPRAAAIAELVLWIGYLQWHFRTRGGVPPEPILRDFKTIKVMDSVLAWDGKELARDEQGRPLERIDTEGRQFEVWRYRNPKRPEWPTADYIVGNPPFVGAKYLRERLGYDYAQALWAAHPQMNESADFVMYWWDRAAELLTCKGTALQRFGFVTTNSLSQVFQRRVMERHLKAKTPVSLLMAIADHPWTKATRDAAAVRIAMTVAAKGRQDGVLFEVVREEGLETDAPHIELSEKRGTINSDLTIGADVTKAAALASNDFICSPGVKLHGDGFIVTPAEAEYLGLGRRPELEKHIRLYRNGRDLLATPRGVMVIDLFGLEQDEVRHRFPEVYQHVLASVKESKDAQGRPNGRDVNNRESYRLNWWVFGEPRREFRPALEGLSRYIVTPVTAKHRIFQFMPTAVLSDDALMCFGLHDGVQLGILSSYVFLIWFKANNSTLENRPRFIKSSCFDPFPFPWPSEDLKSAIRATAEELDALRKQVQAESPSLTLTQIYNVLEKLRASVALNADEEAIKTKGLVLIVKELHDRLDALVAKAYGWPENLSDEEILQKLVALNAERAAEEKRGLIRWLRPDYQMRRAGVAVATAPKVREDQLEAPLVAAAAKLQKPSFPTGDLERTAAVFDALMGASAPLDEKTIARGFRQGAKVEAAIARVLASLARLGHVHSSDGKTFALRRRA